MQAVPDRRSSWESRPALHFGSGKQVRLEAIFDAAAAEYLLETPLAEDQDIAPIDAALASACFACCWPRKSARSGAGAPPEGSTHQVASVERRSTGHVAAHVQQRRRKSMLVRRIPGILPSLTEDESPGAPMLARTRRLPSGVHPIP